MEQHMIMLITQQDELSTVNEARIQKSMAKKNLMTLLRTKNVKFNGNILRIGKQISQMKKKNFNPTTTIAIASLENDRAKEIIIFCLINNTKSDSNRSSNMANEIVPVRMRINHKYEHQESAQAHKITAVINDQLESSDWNISICEVLENLQWNNRPYEESYRCRFLKIFYYYAINLRAIGNYYAAKTSRYTIIQKNLLPRVVEVIEKKIISTTKENRSSILCEKKSQSYRIILKDDKSKIEDRAIENQRDYESLKKENEMLGLALRKAADLHIRMMNAAEENLQEKNKLIEEKRALEDRNNDLSAKNKKLEKLSLKADKLKKKKISLEKSRQVYEEDKKKFIARKEVFEKFNIENSVNLKEEIELLKKERWSIEENRQEISSQKKDLQKLQSKAKIESDNLKSKEIMINQNYEVKTNELKEKKEEMDWHYLAEENRLKQIENSFQNQQRNLETREKNVNDKKRELDNEANRLENMKQLLEQDRQRIENLRSQHSQREKEFEEYCEENRNRMIEIRREIENQRQELERQRRNFAEEREENIRRVVRNTPSNNGSNDIDYIEIPILPQILSWKLNLSPFSR